VNDQRPAPYTEARSALNGALLAFGLLPLAAEIVCLVIGLTASQPWFFVFMAGLSVLVMISTGLLYRSWPTGLRVDESASALVLSGRRGPLAADPPSITRAGGFSAARGRPSAVCAW
jgi:hypothetical protein